MKKNLKRWLIIFFVVIALDITATTITISRRDQALPAEFTHPVSAAIVFFRDFNKSKTDIGPDNRRRLNQAIALYRRGLIQEVACIGGARKNRQLYGAEFMKQYLVSQGIPPGKIFVDRETYDSNTNWQVARRIMTERGWRDVALVASPFHIERLARVVQKDPLPGVTVWLSPYSTEKCQPPVSWIDEWKEAHYEWLAAAAALIPSQYYAVMIQKWREVQLWL